MSEEQIAKAMLKLLAEQEKMMLDVHAFGIGFVRVGIDGINHVPLEEVAADVGPDVEPDIASAGSACDPR